MLVNRTEIKELSLQEQESFRNKQADIELRKLRVEHYVKLEAKQLITQELAALSKLCKELKTDIEGIKAQARAALDLNAFTLAIDSAEILLEYSPDDEELLIVRALAIARSNRTELFPQATSDLEKIHLKNSDLTPPCHFAASIMYFKLNLKKKGRDHFYLGTIADAEGLVPRGDRITVLDLRNESILEDFEERKGSAEELVAEADKQLRRNKPEEAFLLYTQAIKKDQIRHDYYDKRSKANLALKLNAAALAEIMTARWVYERLDQNGKALPDGLYYYMKIRDLNIEDSEISSLRLSVIAQNRMVSMSKRAYGDDTPMVKQLNDDFASFLLKNGKECLENDRLDRAIQLLLKAYEYQQDNIAIYLTLASAYHQSQRKQDAEAILNKAAEKWGDHKKIASCRKLLSGAVTADPSGKEQKSASSGQQKKKVPVEKREKKSDELPAHIKLQIAEEKKEDRKVQEADRKKTDANEAKLLIAALKFASEQQAQKNKAKALRKKAKLKANKHKKVNTQEKTDAVDVSNVEEIAEADTVEELVDTTVVEETATVADEEKNKDQDKDKIESIVNLLVKEVIDSAVANFSSTPTEKKEDVLLISFNPELAASPKPVVPTDCAPPAHQLEEKKQTILTTAKLSCIFEANTPKAALREDNRFLDHNDYKAVDQILMRAQESIIMDLLENSGKGNSALMVGSSVRSRLWQTRRKKVPLLLTFLNHKKDVDIFCTNTPEEITACLKPYKVVPNRSLTVFKIKFKDDNGIEINGDIYRCKDKTIMQHIKKICYTQCALVANKFGHVFDLLGRAINDLDEDILETVIDAATSFQVDGTRMWRGDKLAEVWGIPSSLRLQALRKVMDENSNVIPNMEETFRIHSLLINAFTRDKVDGVEARRNANMMFQRNYIDKLFHPSVAEVLKKDQDFIFDELVKRPVSLQTILIIFYVSYMRTKEDFDLQRDKSNFLDKHKYINDVLEKYMYFDEVCKQISFHWTVFHWSHDVSLVAALPSGLADASEMAIGDYALGVRRY